MIVAYYSVCYRSEKLLRLNFKNTFNLYTSVVDWVNKRHPVEVNRGIIDSIHGCDKSFARSIEKGVIVY